MISDTVHMGSHNISRKMAAKFTITDVPEETDGPTPTGERSEGNGSIMLVLCDF